MRTHRISSGAIVIEDDRVLLVRHSKNGAYNFWVAPGGGITDEEDLLRAAVREVKEETGLVVVAVKPIYIEQFYQPDIHHIKTWILCTLVSGETSTSAPEAVREHKVEAKYMERQEIVSLTIPIFPTVLKDQMWTDRELSFSEFKFLGIRAMKFY